MRGSPVTSVRPRDRVSVHMPHRPLLLVCLLPLLLGARPVRAQDAPRKYPDGIVAIVDGVPVTRYELELSCQLRSDYRDLTPGSTARRRIQYAELQELVKNRVLLKKAQDEKLKFSKQDEARLKLELARQAQNYGGPEGLRQALKAIGVPFEYFVARQRDNILIGKLLVKNISRDIFVTPAEIRRHYEQHLAKYKRPGETRLRQIVIYPDPDDAVRLPAAVKKKVAAKQWKYRAFAKRVWARVTAGKEPFAKVSKETSMGVKAGEELVFESSLSLEDVLEPPLGRYINRLRPGQITPVVETVRGTLYIIQLVDRREAGVLPLEEVQREIEVELKEQIWKQRLERWIEKARKDSLVRVYLTPPKSNSK